MSECYEVRLYDYIEKIHKLSKLIKSKGWDKRNLIAISRGGLLPGTIISHDLNNRNLNVIGVKSYNDNNERENVEIIQKPYSDYTTIDEILLIDDLIESGNTINNVKAFLKINYNCNDIKTVVVYDKRITKNISEVDLSIKNINPDKWIVFPYEQGA